MSFSGSQCPQVKVDIPRVLSGSDVLSIHGSRTVSHPPRIQPGFCMELCASQTLGYSGRKLVTLPNKSSCSLISHNSAESNHNSDGNKKLPGCPPQLIPDKHACPGFFLNPPIKDSVGLMCNRLQWESQDKALNLFLLPPQSSPTHSLFLQLFIFLLILLIFKINLHVFVYFFIVEKYT